MISWEDAGVMDDTLGHPRHPLHDHVLETKGSTQKVLMKSLDKAAKIQSIDGRKSSNKSD